MGSEAKSMDIKKMEIKKTDQSSTKENALSRKKVEEFIASIKSEIQKIQWTTKDELIVYTKIVVVATFVFGMAIYFMDLTVQGVLTALNLLLRLISG